MSNSVHAMLGCQVVGDYLDVAEIPESLVTRVGEVVRPRLVSDDVESGTDRDGLREFTVLLKDGRVVSVRGHVLKHEPHPVAGQDVFGIVVRSETEEALVAMFKGADISGIFSGDLSANRKIA